MVEFVKGNLLKSDAEALVNTVNCVGVMGKGIALQMKQAFPDMYKEYEKSCKKDELEPGKVLTYHTGLLYNPRFIINFPTKKHWKGKSKIEFVQSGLKALQKEIEKLGIKSIAIPPLGCGNGGLDWMDVKPLILDALKGLENVRVLVYEPLGTPPAKEMPVNTSVPNMTKARALLIRLLELYKVPGYSLTLMEVQKLAYFLQVAGEPLRLNYRKHMYGPYAENLNFVLQRIEGHFIRGYGDRSKGSAQIEVVSDAIEKAHKYLDQHPDVEKRLEKIKCLIDGFESPYGLELLSTIHWTATEKDSSDESFEELSKAVWEWSDRKNSIMKTSHLLKAWGRLKACGWLNSDHDNGVSCNL